MEKQAGTKTRSARRSSTCAAADDDPRGAPRRRPQPGGFGTASEHQPTAKAKGERGGMGGERWGMDGVMAQNSKPPPTTHDG